MVRLTAVFVAFLGERTQGAPLTHDQATAAACAFTAYSTDGKLLIPKEAPTINDRIIAGSRLSGASIPTVKKLFDHIADLPATATTLLYSTDKRGAGSSVYPLFDHADEAVLASMAAHVDQQLASDLPA
jgi:hypothetical protein